MLCVNHLSPATTRRHRNRPHLHRVPYGRDLGILPKASLVSPPNALGAHLPHTEQPCRPMAHLVVLVAAHDAHRAPRRHPRLAACGHGHTTCKTRVGWFRSRMATAVDQARQCTEQSPKPTAPAWGSTGIDRSVPSLLPAEYAGAPLPTLGSPHEVHPRVEVDVLVDVHLQALVAGRVVGADEVCGKGEERGERHPEWPVQKAGLHLAARLWHAGRCATNHL